MLFLFSSILVGSRSEKFHSSTTSTYAELMLMYYVAYLPDYTLCAYVAYLPDYTSANKVLKKIRI